MHKELFDLVSGQPVTDCTIVWPALRYILEPLTGFAEYILSFTRYIVQLVSWIAWLMIVTAGWAIVRKKTLRDAGVNGMGVVLFFLTVVVVVLVFPLSWPRLVTPSGTAVVDFHSHTFYSHDGIKSPTQSIAFHRRLGYTEFFVTEHGHTNGFPQFSAAAQYATVFPGMQVSTKERVSLLIFADRQFDGAEFRDKTVSQVIDLAHRYGFVVVCPHWWKWRYFSWDELYKKGIDGFEIYNAGYRNFSAEERARLVQFCRDNHLVMLGNTDWHGWGSMTDVWTVVPGVTPGVGAPLMQFLREHRSSRVLVNLQPEAQGTLRYFFEPFCGAYYYFSAITVPQACGLMGWIIVIVIAGRFSWCAQFRRLIPQIFGLGLLALVFYCLFI